MNFEQNGWGQPPGLAGNNHVPTDLGFFVSEEYYDKINRRSRAAGSAVAQANSGKRITGFKEGPFNNLFFQQPINDADAYAHVAYWLAVAGMATGNRNLIKAASKYKDSAFRWSAPFARMKTGGIGKIYEGGKRALFENAGPDRNNQTVKYVSGIFRAQGVTERSDAARERAVQQDPVRQATDAVKQTVTTAPKWKRIPWWGYAIAGASILGVVLYLRGGGKVMEKTGRLVRRKRSE